MGKMKCGTQEEATMGGLLRLAKRFGSHGVVPMQKQEGDCRVSCWQPSTLSVLVEWGHGRDLAEPTAVTGNRNTPRSPPFVGGSSTAKLSPVPAEDFDHAEHFGAVQRRFANGSMVDIC